MKTIRATSPLLLAVALAWAPCATTRADEATSQISFSDPSKPGTLKVRVWHGDVSVRGDDVKEITVKSDSTSLAPTPRKDGMRVLSTSSSFLLSEKDNVAVLEYGGEGWAGGSADFEITVPRSTSVIVSNSAHGELSCSGLSGDIDVRTMSGDVKLEDVTGGALVETMNGEIGVDVKSLSPSRPLSFTSMHGEITIHLPSDSKANILFRTHRGVIMSNFDDKALVTKTEIAHRASQQRVAPVKAVPPTSPVSPPAPSADAPPKPIDGKDLSNREEARSQDSDGDWHNDVSASIKEAAEEAALAAHAAADAVREGLAEAHVQISGVIPPLPPMTGGKVVTGTLNGGGTQIQAATLSGDILLKKAD
jgi:hypothetical protein